MVIWFRQPSAGRLTHDEVNAREQANLVETSEKRTMLSEEKFSAFVIPAPEI